MKTFDWGKDFAQVGGKEVSVLDAAARYNVSVTAPYIDFGAMPRFTWGDQTEALNAAIEAQMPKFQITGTIDPSVKKATLFDTWSHPLTVSSLGFAFPGIHQLTGSCVGAGGGNVAFSLLAIQAITLRKPEEIVVPFWPFTYGRGRLRSGSRNPGEGSSGTGQSEAMRLDGIMSGVYQGLPSFTHNDGIVYSSSIEMSWSDGDAAQAMNLLPVAQKHLIKTVAKLKSSDDVRAAICAGYPVTEASMYGFNPRVEGEGSDAVLVGRRGPRWSHQMSFHGWWEHPKLGELFWLQNQWGLNAHGRDPSGGPLGGVWVPKSDVDWLIRDGDECFAFSQFDGFPAQTFEWGAY